ncbi:MAG: collagen binding domain-containing protein, partial [Planctomycetota bacterium]
VAVFTDLDADTYTVSIDGSQPSLVALKPSAPEAASTSVALPAGELKVVDSVWCEDLFSITGFVRREPECIPWWNSRGDGLGGVKVELRLATDLPTAPPRFTETTTANGFYAFLDIPQGSYVVSVPPGQVPLKDMTATSPTKVRVKEAPAEVNFYFGSAGVLVEVLVDIDAGGTPDGGLRTTVTLEKLDPPGQGTTFRARTDANGRIRFPLPSQNALLPGSWRVSIPRQPNLIPKGPLSVIVDLAVCAPETVRFEFYGTCSIVGTVIKETVDCDGVRQRDEPGIARVEVVLLQVSPAAPARKATTDALGNYRFTRLPRGSYIVVVDGGQPMLVDLKPNSPTSVRVICVPPDEARVDFYFCAPGRICGTVFREPLQDCDGEYDRGDTGLGGVVVTLTPIDPAGRPISKGTQKDGSYCFPTLDPGRYSVSVDPSQPLLIDLGSTTATVVAVNLDPAEVETVDFGFAEQAIEGIVFREPVNASDGIYDPGVDTGIPGVTVRAVKLTQPDRGMVRMAVTGVGGSYFLNDLPPGGWEVTVESGVRAGLVPTTPEIVRLRLPVCQVGEANFGFSPEPLSSICGTVFLEKWDECNGVFDGNDVGIPGVTVQLVKKDEPGKGRRKNTVTDAKGDYCFDDLPAGRYLVKVPGRQPQLVDLSPSTPEKQRVVTQPGDKIEDVDFGYCPPCPREPCCEGDLHEVVIETRFWVDEWTEWYDIYAFFREECAPGAAEIDYAGVFYRGDFPGAVTGYNDVLSLESATREGNWLYVRLRLTAQGCAFPRGFFGNKDRCVVVTFNGKRKVGHTIFRCEYVRPGSWFTSGEDCKLPECPPDGETKVLTTEAWNDRPDGCRADYRVLDTYGWNNWLTCEGKPECKEQSETSKCGYNLVELELDYWVKKGEREHEYGVRLRKWGQVDMDGVDLMFSGTEWHGAKKGWGGMLTLTDLKRVKKGQYADLWRARMLIQACDRCDGNPSPLPEQLAVDSTLDEWTHDYWLDLNYSSNPPMEVGPVLWRGEFTGVSILRWLSVEDAAWCPPNVCRDCPDDQPCTDCGDRPGGGDDPNGEPRGG